ncbi:hypothetical protein [Sphingomonas sp. R-74633]|nr:hypothetical protein [Sphingomonas sp. R-74633]
MLFESPARAQLKHHFSRFVRDALFDLSCFSIDNRIISPRDQAGR